MCLRSAFLPTRARDNLCSNFNYKLLYDNKTYPRGFYQQVIKLSKITLGCVKFSFPNYNEYKGILILIRSAREINSADYVCY